jgi:hypothetical protein
LDLARHLELPFQGEPIRHFEQDQEVQQQEGDDDREGAVCPHGHRDGDLEERQSQWEVDGREAAK